MNDMTADVEVNLTGDLERRSKASEKAIHRMATRSARDLKNLKRASIGLSNGIDKLGNRYTGLAIAAATGFAGRGVVNFGKRLKDIEVQAGLSTEKMATLKKSIFSISQAKDVRLDPTQLLAAFDAVIEKTGDFDLAANNLRNMGLAIRATGAQGAEIGAVIAGLKKLDITAPAEVAQALELLTEQGKAGAFTMQNMAREAGPLLASMAAIGQKGMDGVRTLGSLAQVAQMATDNATESSTAIQGLIREIASKGKDLEALGVGINVFDPKALAEGREEFLALDKIVKSIVTASKGSFSNITKTFGEEAQKALKVLVADFQNTGQLGSFDQFLKMDGSSGQLEKDAANKATTADAAITSLNAAMQRMADHNLSKPIQDMADAINSIEPEKLNDLFDIAATGVAAAAGIWAVNKAARGLFGGFRAVQAFRGVTGGKVGNILNRATAQPVMVTNWPVGFGSAAGGMTGGGRKAAAGRRGRLGMLSKAGRFLGRAAPVAAMMSMLSFGNAAVAGDGRGMAASGGMLAGGLAGAKLGALGGALLGPIGAGVGAVVGGGLGAWGGEELIASLFDFFKGNKSEDKSNQGNAEVAEAMNSHTRALSENTEALKESRQDSLHVGGHADMGGMGALAP